MGVDGTDVGVGVARMDVGVGGTRVGVGGTGVAVGGIAVAVGGIGVAVGGMGVAVGATDVAVGAGDVAVGAGAADVGAVVGVDGEAVAVAGTEVAVGLVVPPAHAMANRASKVTVIRVIRFMAMSPRESPAPPWWSHAPSPYLSCVGKEMGLFAFLPRRWTREIVATCHGRAQMLVIPKPRAVKSTPTAYYTA